MKRVVVPWIAKKGDLVGGRYIIVTDQKTRRAALKTVRVASPRCRCGRRLSIPKADRGWKCKKCGAEYSNREAGGLLGLEPNGYPVAVAMLGRR